MKYPRNPPLAGVAACRRRRMGPPFLGAQPVARASRQRIIDALIERGELAPDCEGGAAVDDPTNGTLYALVEALDAAAE